jgi:hypothetical protein
VVFLLKSENIPSSYYGLLTDDSGHNQLRERAIENQLAVNEIRIPGASPDNTLRAEMQE